MGEAGRWREGPPLPGPRSDFAVVHDSERGKVVLAAGASSPRMPVAETWTLDVAKGSWSKGEPIPHPRSGPGYVAAHGRLLVLGGLKPNFATSDVAQALDLRTGGWTDLPALPLPLAWPRAVLVGEELHLVGGWNVVGPEQERALDVHFVLALGPDGARGGWQEAPPLPAPVFAGVLLPRGKEILWAGGATRMGWPAKTDRHLYDMQVTPGSWTYDPSWERWKEIAPLPEGRRMAVGLSTSKAVGVLGGLDGSATPRSETFWLGTDELWRPGPPLPRTCHHAAGVVVGDEWWVLGGDYSETPPPTLRIGLKDLTR